MNKLSKQIALGTFDDIVNKQANSLSVIELRENISQTFDKAAECEALKKELAHQRIVSADLGILLGAETNNSETHFRECESLRANGESNE